MSHRTRSLSYSRGSTDVPLLEETIGARLRSTVELFVVRDQGFRSSYAEIWDQVDRVARGLVARDVRKGDRVGIWAPNWFEWYVTQFATARIGAILVTINPAYKTTELEYALNKAGVSLLLYAAGFRQADYRAMLDEVRRSCSELREEICFEDGWAELLEVGARG